MAFLQKIPQPSVTEISLKITFLKFCSNLPGANELKKWYWLFLSKGIIVIGRDIFRKMTSPMDIKTSSVPVTDQFARSILQITLSWEDPVKNISFHKLLFLVVKSQHIHDYLWGSQCMKMDYCLGWYNELPQGMASQDSELHHAESWGLTWGGWLMEVYSQWEMRVVMMPTFCHLSDIYHLAF